MDVSRPEKIDLSIEDKCLGLILFNVRSFVSLYDYIKIVNFETEDFQKITTIT